MKKKREKVEDSVFMSQVFGLFLDTCLQKKCLLVQEKKNLLKAATNIRGQGLNAFW